MSYSVRFDIKGDIKATINKKQWHLIIHLLGPGLNVYVGYLLKKRRKDAHVHVWQVPLYSDIGHTNNRI